MFLVKSSPEIEIITAQVRIVLHSSTYPMTCRATIRLAFLIKYSCIWHSSHSRSPPRDTITPLNLICFVHGLASIVRVFLETSDKVSDPLQGLLLRSGVIPGSGVWRQRHRMGNTPRAICIISPYKHACHLCMCTCLHARLNPETCEMWMA